MRALRPLAGALAVLLSAALLALLLVQGFPPFPSFKFGKPASLRPVEEMNEALPYVIWEDRFPDLIAQASLALLAAAVGVAMVRLWRGEERC
ncbi:MAG TPA: hypothetical protein ENF78_00370 [Candidatus Bathyarchaeota archaeon]|nr:hypothetical protein [Candidatus Bathyarchaeota archaeon]